MEIALTFWYYIFNQKMLINILQEFGFTEKSKNLIDFHAADHNKNRI